MLCHADSSFILLVFTSPLNCIISSSAWFNLLILYSKTLYRTWPWWHNYLRLPASPEKKYFLFKPPSLWYWLWQPELRQEWMDEPWKQHAKWNNSDTKDYIWVHYMKCPEKKIHRKSRLVTAKWWGQGELGLSANGYGLLLGVMGMSWQWLHSIVNILKIAELYTLILFKWWMLSQFLTFK